MMRLFLCEARRRKHSIVGLCEHFARPQTRAKRTHQNDFKHKRLSETEQPFVFRASSNTLERVIISYTLLPGQLERLPP